MADILVRPQRAPVRVDTEMIELEIVLREEDFAGVFDELEVWRSRTAGRYEQLTGDSWEPARLPDPYPGALDSGSEGPPLAVQGKDLRLRIDRRHDLIVVLTETRLRAVAQEIESQSRNLLRCSGGEGGVLRVETTTPGSAAHIEVVGGEASPHLFAPGQIEAIGKVARIGLRLGHERYLFADIHGGARYLYKTRFRNSATGALSDFSDSFSADSATVRRVQDLVVGRLELRDPEGRALAGMEVRLEPKGLAHAEGALAGVTPLVRSTNERGCVEFELVRGLRATVAIQGTPIVRDIVAPSNPVVESFDLLGREVRDEASFFTVDNSAVPLRSIP